MRDEITAHKTGAAFIDKSLLGLGVDTIFEIGGQDAKFISLAGRHRGGLHDERGLRRGHRQLPRGARAGAGHPDRGGVRGAGALEPQPRSVSASGAPCSWSGTSTTACGEGRRSRTSSPGSPTRSPPTTSTASSAGRRIGETIFLQGGTAYNDAVAAALSAVVGKRIIVPPFNGVMGALGVALLAREKMASSGAASLFRGYAPARGRLRDVRVHLPGLHQLLPDAARHGGGAAHLLGRQVLGALPQGRPRRARARHRGPRRVPAGRGCSRATRRRRDDGPVVGLPFCMSTYDWAPFWFAVFRALGRAGPALGADPERHRQARASSRPSRSRASPWSSPTATSAGCWRRRSTSSSSPTTSPRPGTLGAGRASSARGTRRCRSWRARRRSSSSTAHKLIAPTLWYNQGERAVAASLRAGLRRRRPALVDAPRGGGGRRGLRGAVRRSGPPCSTPADSALVDARDVRRARRRPAGPPLQHLRRGHQPRDRHQAAGVLRRQRRALRLHRR